MPFAPSSKMNEEAMQSRSGVGIIAGLAALTPVVSGTGAASRMEV